MVKISITMLWHITRISNGQIDDYVVIKKEGSGKGTRVQVVPNSAWSSSGLGPGCSERGIG
jgi:hypothetical protein